jgi:cell surface protein SprA
MRSGKLGIVMKLSWILTLMAAVWVGSAMIFKVSPMNMIFPKEDKSSQMEVAVQDTTDLPWPNQDNINPQENQGGVSLPLPDNIQYEVIYDPITGQYQVVQTVGGIFNYRNPTLMTLDEYMEYNMQQNITEYWNEIQEEEDEANRNLVPILDVGGEGFRDIFGSNEIEIRPQGSAALTFGVNISKTDNPRIPERQRRIATFDFDQRIQLNVVGNIGTKMQLSTNYNTEATFDFENQMKLEYTGEEDEIIKKIEAGNVSMPLKGTLITGSQSLFGLKIDTQFGRLYNSTVFSQQKGERKEITVEGGAQTQLFDIQADNYDANRHYFLSNWFRDQYDVAMASLPVVNSGVNVTRIEVWVVNTQANTENVRNLVAFTDMGEHPDYFSPNLNVNDWLNGSQLAISAGNPSNTNNDMHEDFACLDFNTANAIASAAGLIQGLDYERVGNARMLSGSEYTYNSRLGFISLRQALNNAEVLAVSYEYTLNGQTYKVGTLSQDGCTSPNAMGVKLLKSSVTNVNSPLWDHMMKNVYNIGAFGVQNEDFRLDVWYNNPATGVDQNYLAFEGLQDKLLIQHLNLDRIDVNQMGHPDGIFDYIDNAATIGGTIHSQNGRIFFPVVEPFGAHLAGVIEDKVTTTGLAANLINSVVFSELYDSTKTAAQQIPAKNRFKIRGQFKSTSGSQISLNALNIPEGSVTVTSGGTRLYEGTDYTVDYNLGRVTIINDGILQSGAPINISLESNSLFNIQTKTMIGSRFDYVFDDNFTIGATVLNLRERPLTQKVNMGDEPVNNTILGMDLAYQTESEWLTRMVDAIPLIDTKAKSTVDISAEAAYLIPGHSRAIGKDGNAYVDDFEGSQSTIDIRSINQWFLASTPKNNPIDFPEGNLEDSLLYGYNRARLSWYVIDPLFFRSNSLTPPNITADMQSDHRMREVLENEVFPNRELPAGTPPNVPTLDLSFYPSERGQYNYDTPDPGGTSVSAGLNEDGSLREPDSRWGGIQRSLTTTDFEASNIEFIQFWVMDPFHGDAVQNNPGGDLYFNLGNVSEDILNDSQLSYENGYPTSNNPLPILESIWGFYPDPSNFNVVNAFDNSSGSYSQQDIGIDGMTSSQERDFHDAWLQDCQNQLSGSGYNKVNNDPSADDFRYFRGSAQDSEDLDVLERYKQYNGYEGNANTATPDGYPITATTIPNTEDINQDLTLNTIESYYQYKVSLRPADLGESNIGSNYITDSFVASIENLPNGDTKSVRWYQFKVPVKEFSSKYGGIQDFRSIRYIRMFMKGWSKEVTLRFARLELVRGEWRRYTQSLDGPQEIEPNDPDPTTFNISAVNIEENGNREPVPYVIPPGIIREIDVGTANLRNLNEQSMGLEVCNLKDGDARAAYRTVNFDMRQYKKLKMFIHAEAGADTEDLDDDDVTCFIRLGSDFDANYYEYELPLKITPWGTNDDNEIWPEANNMEIVLKDLQDLKIQRPQGYSLLQEYSQMTEDNRRITVKGNPNLSNVVIVMIGIRNPDDLNNSFTQNDDGLAKCAGVWVNELRLSDFDESGGWAAVARMNANLADFGTFQVAANMSTPGWGTLEQRVQERQRETVQGIDANSTLRLGKFFPEQLGVQLPMYVGYSETVTTPQYDPLSPDLELADLPNLSRARKKKSQTMVRRRSINFTNVKISPTGGGSKDKGGKDDGGKGGQDKGGSSGGKGNNASPFYAVSNFSLSYAYTEVYLRDINTEFNMNKNYRGGLDYTWNNRPKEIKPFAKIGFVKKSPYLKWIKDFNFYPGIKLLSLKTDMDRTYETSRVRNNTAELFGIESDVLIQTQVMKTWNWTRQYNFRYDLTKSLKFDFNANSNSLVGEPLGVIDKEDQDYWTAYKDTVWQNIKDFGETTNYNHGVNVNYKLPLDKFPLVNFISADAKYAGTFRWDRAPFTQDSIGHNIQNSRNLTLNAQANFLNLYNKVPLLKEINSTKPKKGKNNKEVSNDKKDGFGNIIEDDKEKEPAINPLHEFLRLLMTVQNVSGSFSRNEGIMLPGYNRDMFFGGFDKDFDGPGWPFLIGQPNTNLRGESVSNYALEAAQNGWINQSQFQNQQYSETFSENWNLRANLEPIKHLKIELTANKQISHNKSSFFRFDDALNDYVFDSPMENGNITASVITWPTTFVKDDADFSSQTFLNFLSNRTVISDRLNAQSFNDATPLANGYYDGWGPTAQNVVIPAFIAAYTGTEASSVSMDPFKAKVLPNWRLTYDGLTKNQVMKQYFKQFSINHTYRSTLTTQYVQNLDYVETPDGLPAAVDQSEFQNYVVERQINTVTVSEQLSPLIGFDMTIKTEGKNDPQIKLEWKKDRTVSLGMSNYQITETKRNSLVMGIGYKFTDVPNPFIRSKKSRLPIAFLDQTQLEVRADLTITDNVTIIRKMVELQNQPTAGQKLISLKTSADMKVSDKLTLRFFYDHQLTRPKISTSFPTSNISSGISLQFTLS